MQPLNIAVVSLKGGIGKSNTSLLLFEAFRHVGKIVRLNDWDGQGTSTKALRSFYPEYESEKAASPEIVIYDTPPSLEHTATATAVRSADIVLVVTSPSPADIWEADDAVRFAKSKNSKAAVRVVFNKVRKSTVLGRLVEESGKQLSAPVLKVSLSARECYQHAVAQGWRALDSAARQEVLQLIVALL